MIGTSTLTVNIATMKLIVQQWADMALGNGVVVDSVKAEDQYSFAITLKTPEPAETENP